MKKKIAYTLVVILSILIITAGIGIQKFNKALFSEKPNYLNYSFEYKPIHFDWAKRLYWISLRS